MGQRLPYYEGGHLIPDSVRVEAGELVTARDHGLRWFALAARPARLDDRAAASLFEAASGAPAGDARRRPALARPAALISGTAGLSTRACRARAAPAYPAAGLS